MGSTSVNVVEQLADDLWVITETGSVHCYVVIGEERALIFDIGYGYEDIRPLVREITDKPFMLAVSHGDPDHALGCGWFDEVWIHPLDWGKVLWNDTKDMRSSALEYRLKKMPQLKGEIDRDAFLSRRIGETRPRFLLDGDRIDLGGTELEVIHTPGHSYGHVMLFDRSRGRLFTGDQVTAHNVWYFQTDDFQAPFTQSVASLKTIKRRCQGVRELLPAHDVTPLSPTAIDDQIECFEHELRQTYQDDERFDSFIGLTGYKHLYKTVDLIYSDERLAEYLGHEIRR